MNANMMEQENSISPPPPIDYIFTPKSCDATEGLTFSGKASKQSKQQQQQHDDKQKYSKKMSKG